MKKLRYIILPFSILAVVFGVVVYYYKIDSGLLTRLSFYLDLANPAMRLVNVQEGLRKEEIAEVVAKKLNWDEQDKQNFINAHLALNDENLEGKYFPKTYVIHKDESPVEVSNTMVEEYSKQVEKIKSKTKAKRIINDETALKIASLIQRESGGKGDMRLISGIIWNRIFSGMKLQVDATLQYAKGSEENVWWRRVSPEDKKIDSDYNTYLNKGLPPSAIANPGADAIYAAYNPIETDCMFYLHDKNRKIHCAETYEEHKQNIEKYLK
jgi:UPF0755 protein